MVMVVATGGAMGVDRQRHNVGLAGWLRLRMWVRKPVGVFVSFKGPGIFLRTAEPRGIRFFGQRMHVDVIVPMIMSAIVIMGMMVVLTVLMVMVVAAVVMIVSVPVLVVVIVFVLMV
jgi:hypothetical protein